MKGISRIFRWILIAVLFQVVVFSYLEFIYLPNRGAIKAISMEIGSLPVKNRSISIPSNAEDINVSFTGAYCSYVSGKRIIIKSMQKGWKIKTIDPGGRPTFSRWLPDRDMFLFAVTEPDGKKDAVRISTYDISQKLVRSYPVIKGLSDGSYISIVELSPLTNVVYAGISDGKRLKVYKFDIMDNLKYIMSVPLKTVFFEAMYSDTLVYQIEGGKITVRNGRSGRKKTITLKNGNKLLFMDSEDRIFIGKTGPKSLVERIRIGKAPYDANSWSELKLAQPVPAENIVFTSRSGVYVIYHKDGRLLDTKGSKLLDTKGSKLLDTKGSKLLDNKDGKLPDIKDGKLLDTIDGKLLDIKNGHETSYKGDFLGTIDNYIISREGNKLKLTVIGK